MTPSSPRAAVPQEAEELATLAKTALHQLPVTQHLCRHQRHLLRAEVEAPVDALDRGEDLGVRQVRIAERALLHALVVQQAVPGQPAVVLRLTEQRSAR